MKKTERIALLTLSVITLLLLSIWLIWFIHNPSFPDSTEEVVDTITHANESDDDESDYIDPFQDLYDAEEVYFNEYKSSGDSRPVIDFLKFCDAFFLDSITRDGYKEKILEYYNIKCIYVVDASLEENEFIYYPQDDFSKEGGTVVIRLKELPLYMQDAY